MIFVQFAFRGVDVRFVVQGSIASVFDFCAFVVLRKSAAREREQLSSTRYVDWSISGFVPAEHEAQWRVKRKTVAKSEGILVGLHPEE